MTSRLKNPITRAFVELVLRNKDKATSRILQRALRDVGQKINIDGDIGRITINAIKSTNNKNLFGAYFAILRPVKKEHLANKKIPLWLNHAYDEVGVKECRGKKCSNPRVEQYHDAIGLGWAKDDVPWCGAYVGWAMLKAGYRLQNNPARALSWLNFGKSAHKPVLGAIAVKSRKGGGHVTFVVGISKGGDFIYCLGGNQNDAVNIRRYPTRVFRDFRIPNDYTPQPLPIMDDKSRGRTREG